MIYKGLDDEEASFLTFVAQRQADQETEMIRREIEEVHSFRVRIISSVMEDSNVFSLPPFPLYVKNTHSLTNKHTHIRE